MNKTIVRICQIELNGFKNIEYGLIEMPLATDKNFFSNTADILGIYGQNGSGKTAVIEAMEFIQILLTGEPLPAETVHYISKKKESCTITVKFTIETANETSLVDYAVELKRLEKDDFEIVREVIGATRWNGEKFEARKTLINYNAYSDDALFTPQYRFEALIRNNDKNAITLGVAKILAHREHFSFIFGNEGRAVFLSAPDNVSSDYNYIINSLYQYARLNLFVISNAHSGAISMNFLIPFAFRLDTGKRIAKGDLAIRLDEPSLISNDEYNIINRIINEMNTVLSTMIPAFSIEVHNFGEQLLEDSSLGYKIELISKREGIAIPLKYESEGIIKIISLLNVLMCIYNDPSMCLIIDELDAGIYEYLLGELLAVFEKGAKGQLIFTAHNLRALEMLNKKSIVLATTNSKNRYIRLQYVKSNNNLRDMYLRSISLGGQKEDVYAETDSIEIGRAFRRAGKVVQYGTKN